MKSALRAFFLVMVLSLAFGCSSGGGDGDGDGGGVGAGLGVEAQTPNANRSPSLATIGDRTIAEGQTLSFAVTATDPDAADTLTFSVSNLPLNAGFDPATKTFTWTPGLDQSGVYPVLFQVTDNGTPPLSASESITIAVGDVNRPPALAPIGNKEVNEGDTLAFTVSATDPDGNLVTCAIGNAPPGSSFDPTTGAFTWTPSFEQTGTYPDIRFTATDEGSPVLTATEAITITVGNVNRPPSLSPIGDKTVSEWLLLEFVVTASDPDGDGLVFSATDLPAGAIFDPATQRFSWTPTCGQAAGGPYWVTFTVQDTASPMELDQETISITALNANRAPQFSLIGSQTTTAGALLEFFVSATDPDGNDIMYSSENLPTGASFDPTTQQFSWTPDAGQVRYYVVTFYATDNGSPSMRGQIDVSITVGNTPTPITRIDDIIEYILSLHLPKAIENSYLANLKSAKIFLEDGKATDARNQMEAFVNKVNVDIADSLIDPAIGAILISMGTEVIDILQ